MKKLMIGSFAVLGAATCTAASPAATLLFAQEGTQIVDATGLARTAKKGDLVQSGERVLTPTGAISQIKLPDGSLIGVRPGSELRLTAPEGPNPAPVVSLIQGAARVIGSELMDAKKLSNITFQSGVATLRLQGADLESAVVRADKGATTMSGPQANAPGSYQKLLVGTGSIGAGTQFTALTRGQVSFVGAANNPSSPEIANRMPGPPNGSPAMNAKSSGPEPTDKISRALPKGLNDKLNVTDAGPKMPENPKPMSTPMPAPFPMQMPKPIEPFMPPPPTVIARFEPIAPVVQPVLTLRSEIYIQPKIVCTSLIAGKCI